MTNYIDLYRDLLSQYFDGRMTREDMVKIVADQVPIDVVYASNSELLSNCEWSIRHATHQGFFTPDREFNYYLQCLLGSISYTNESRDAALREE